MIFLQPMPVLYAQNEISRVRSTVGDNAHLGAAKIVVKQILEPHSGDKQKVPRVLTAFLDVLDRAFRINYGLYYALYS